MDDLFDVNFENKIPSEIPSFTTTSPLPPSPPTQKKNFFSGKRNIIFFSIFGIVAVALLIYFILKFVNRNKKLEENLDDSVEKNLSIGQDTRRNIARKEKNYHHREQPQIPTIINPNENIEKPQHHQPQNQYPSMPQDDDEGFTPI